MGVEDLLAGLEDVGEEEDRSQENKVIRQMRAEIRRLEKEAKEAEAQLQEYRAELRKTRAQALFEQKGLNPKWAALYLKTTDEEITEGSVLRFAEENDLVLQTSTPEPNRSRDTEASPEGEETFTPTPTGLGTMKPSGKRMYTRAEVLELYQTNPHEALAAIREQRVVHEDKPFPRPVG